MSTEATGFLYPFIEGEERDHTSLLADLARSAREKAIESQRLTDSTLERVQAELCAVAAAMARRFTEGGRLFCLGNGGSATDAMVATGLFAEPPAGRPLPAQSLVADQAVLTAIGNDVGVELMFQRQLIAYAKPGDMVLGFSTSGNSANVMKAFEWAHTTGLFTVGMAGYEGGQMAASEAVQQCFVVASDSVHRIQEAQAALTFALWASVHEVLG